jgi:hypothetical protein
MKTVDVKRALSLLRIVKSYQVAPREALFLDEINWLVQKTVTAPHEALFISYAYKGPDYPAFFKEVSDIFDKAGIKLVDITSGPPDALIKTAKFIVIGGGDIATFMYKMNNLITPTFNPYTAIFDKIKAGTPYLGWNEGSGIVSPKFFQPPANAFTPAIHAIPFQVICNYADSPQNDDTILNYLLNNPTVPDVIGQPDNSNKDGSAVRLEETGGGIIRTPSDPFPVVIDYKVVNGNLVKS